MPTIYLKPESNPACGRRRNSCHGWCYLSASSENKLGEALRRLGHMRIAKMFEGPSLYANDGGASSRGTHIND